ncbi:PucR-like helix-turn-helix protein [Pseudonocardia sediminis]|uniref:PucR-like helix-turn-helix protein n=1 Tax=Pseudonocardia sediminis TaxID=1397368 RepID=A0A4Q7UZT2_PSEST|nr:PucR family transcriptional regulator [Pseudonocardia sediminis]RZT86638.1 PucR-like helix-turn-helix protein [Pseudonocardia sediminis]
MSAPAAADLARLVDAVADRVPALISDHVDTIVRDIEIYRHDDVVPRADLRRSVQHNISYMVAAIRDPSTAGDESAPRETGRRRAEQGVPLPEVLRAFRTGFIALWELLADGARREGDPAVLDTLVAAAGVIWQLSDEYSIAVTEAYRAATADLLVAREQRRSALAEALFTGEPGPEAGPWEVAQLLGLPAEGGFAVVVAETPGMAEEGLPHVERRLAERGVASAWRLSAPLQTGVVSLRHHELDDVVAVLGHGIRGRAGVSPVQPSLRDAPRALRLARIAMTGLPAGRAEVAVFDPGPVAALVALDPDESRRVVDAVFGAVFDLPAEDRTTLLDTARAWFDHGGSADRTAAALFCHANTVRYRLRRLQELTGRSFTEPRDVAELAAALQALRLGRSPGRR